MIKEITSAFLPLLRPTIIVSGRKQNKTCHKSIYLIVYLLFLLFLISNQLVIAQSDGIKKAIEKYQKNFFIWNEPEIRNSNSDSILTVLGRWAWGPCNAVDAEGNFAYIGNGPTFHVLDISDPTKPGVYGEYLTDGYIYDLEVNNRLAFVCIGGGLLILDISDPSMPEHLSFIGISGVAVSFALTDSFAYVTTISGYMRVVDISDPSNPFLRGSIPDVGTYSTSIEAKDGYVYIGSIQYPYLLIVNATNPDNLTKTYFNIEGKGTCSFIRDTLLFLGVSWFTTQLKVYSISNLSTPSFVGQVEIEDSILMNGITVTEDGLTAYVLCLTSVSNTFSKGIYSIDISDLNQPVILDKFERPAQIGTHGIASVHNILFAAYFSGLCGLDISEPNDLRLHFFFPTGGFSEKIQVKDSIAFVASGLAGLWILDVSNPEKPAAISNVHTGGFASDVVVEDSLAYIVNCAAYEERDSTRGLWIIGFSDLFNPTVLSHYIGIVNTPTGYWHPNSISKKDNLILITQSGGIENDSSLEVIDVSDPINPLRLGIFRTSYSAYDISISDTVAFLATADGGLRIINISKPDNPYEISNILNSVFGVIYHEPFVYTSTSVFSIINVDDPFNPFIVSSVVTHSGASSVDLYITGNYAYWADWALGVIDITIPESPVNLSTFWGKDRGRGVAAVEEKIFLADQTMGTWILKNNLITSVESDGLDIFPGRIILYQNYPNPFNPVTSIEFYIPEKEKVIIEVFDVLGRRINTILNEGKESGRYKIEFNSSELSSGIYFYKLTAGNMTTVKKMVIIR